MSATPRQQQERERVYTRQERERVEEMGWALDNGAFMDQDSAALLRRMYARDCRMLLKEIDRLQAELANASLAAPGGLGAPQPS